MKAFTVLYSPPPFKLCQKRDSWKRLTQNCFTHSMLTKPVCALRELDVNFEVICHHRQWGTSWKDLTKDALLMKESKKRWKQDSSSRPLDSKITNRVLCRCAVAPTRNMTDWCFSGSLDSNRVKITRLNQSGQTFVRMLNFDQRLRKVGRKLGSWDR